MGRKKLIINNGDKYGRLEIVKEENEAKYLNGKSRRFRCKCSCGKEIITNLNSLRRGCSLSCGCLQKELMSSRATKHGLSGLDEYQIWKGLRKRCSLKNKKDVKNYGERGISVCERWNNFENFYYDMGKRPSKKHSIDRIDNEKGYYKENCRWATCLEQNNNRRSSVYIEYNGERKTISQWERELGFSRGTITRRLAHGWDMKRAVINKSFRGKNQFNKLKYNYE